jgi:hypothetical protein
VFLVVFYQFYSETNLPIVYCLVDNGVVLLLGVVSLMSTTRDKAINRLSISDTTAIAFFVVLPVFNHG